MSKKFTGITSAGSAIPVYDKDAHEVLSAKLDTSAFSSVSGGFATVNDVISATSGLQPSGDYALTSDLANYQPVSSMTAYESKLTFTWVEI